MRRWAPWAAGLLFVVAIASWLLSAVVSSDAGISVDDAVWASAFMAFPIVGLLLAARRPEHPLGWCWLAGVTALGLGVNLQSIAESAWFPVQTASWTGWVALAGAILVPPAIGLIAFPATFYFPDGHLPGPRWRPVVSVGYAALAVFAIASLFKPTIVTASGVGDNPMGIDQAPWLESVVPFAGAILVMAIVLGALSLIWAVSKGVRRGTRPTEVGRLRPGGGAARFGLHARFRSLGFRGRLGRAGPLAGGRARLPDCSRYRDPSLPPL